MLGAALIGLTTLALPCPLDGHAARLRLHVGALPRGSEISIRSESGALLGTAAPFGAREAQASGIYEFALPPELVRDGHVVVRLSVSHYGVPERAPSPNEVKDAALVCVPARR